MSQPQTRSVRDRVDGLAPEASAREPEKTITVDLETKQVGDEGRVIRFTATDATEDRDGDVVEPSGGDLEWFRQRGSILWAHDSRRPPLATPKMARKANGEIVVDAEFIDPQDYVIEITDDEGDVVERQIPQWAKFADLIYRMARDGVLGSASIGFDPVPDQIERRENGGLRFKEWEMLELSPLPVGANPNAGPKATSYMCAKDAELYDAVTKEWARKVLLTGDDTDLRDLEAKEGRRNSRQDEATLTHAKECMEFLVGERGEDAVGECPIAKPGDHDEDKAPDHDEARDLYEIEVTVGPVSKVYRAPTAEEAKEMAEGEQPEPEASAGDETDGVEAKDDESEAEAPDEGEPDSGESKGISVPESLLGERGESDGGGIRVPVNLE